MAVSHTGVQFTRRHSSNLVFFVKIVISLFIQVHVVNADPFSGGKNVTSILYILAYIKLAFNKLTVRTYRLANKKAATFLTLRANWTAEILSSSLEKIEIGIILLARIKKFTKTQTKETFLNVKRQNGQ